VGVDGITKEQYEQDLEGNLQGLHERLRSRQYLSLLASIPQ
jgi:hypothetical protein